MLSISQMRKPLTRAEGAAVVLDWLKFLGFETTGWQHGRIQKTIVTTIGIALADSSEVVKVLADQVSNAHAVGVALRIFSRSRYNNEEISAVRTLGPVRLTSTSSTPYTIEPGQLIAKTPSGVEFRNTTGGTLLAGSTSSPTTLQPIWEAELAGESGNVALGAITILATPLAGVTVNNDEGDPWYTRAGRDVERDEDLRERNTSKWSTFSLEAIAEAYLNTARNAGAVKVALDDQNPRGPGTIDVYVSGATALLGTAQMEAIQAAFAARLFHTDSTWPASASSRVATLHSPVFDFDFAADVYHTSDDPAALLGALEQALVDLLLDVPLGGYDLSPGPTNLLTLGDVLEALERVEGVRTVVPIAPTTPTITIPVRALVRRGGWLFNLQKLAA